MTRTGDSGTVPCACPILTNIYIFSTISEGEFYVQSQTQDFITLFSGSLAPASLHS